MENIISVINVILCFKNPYYSHIKEALCLLLPQCWAEVGWALVQEEETLKQCLPFACQYSQEQHILSVCQQTAEEAPWSQVGLGQW